MPYHQLNALKKYNYSKNSNLKNVAYIINRNILHELFTII